MTTGRSTIVASGRARPATDTYDNGKPRFRGATLDGKMHGAWKFFRRDGSVMRSGSFDRGAQVGMWRTFDRAGAVVKETRFAKARSRRG